MGFLERVVKLTLLASILLTIGSALFSQTDVFVLFFSFAVVMVWFAGLCEGREMTGSRLSRDMRKEMERKRAKARSEIEILERMWSASFPRSKMKRGSGPFRA